MAAEVPAAQVAAAPAAAPVAAPAAAPASGMQQDLGMRGSYVRKAGLHLEEQEAYAGAGLLPFRELAPGSFEVLLATVPGGLKLFGGKRAYRESALDTAARRLTEECSPAVSQRALEDVRRAAGRSGVIWLRQERYVCFPVNIANMSVVSIREIVDLPALISRARQQGTGQHQAAESLGAQWVPLTSILIPASQPMLTWHPLMVALREDPAFNAWTLNPSSPEDKGFGDLVGPPAKPRTADQGDGSAPVVAGANVNLRVSGIPMHWADAELMQLCSQFGAVKRCTVWLDAMTKQSKGYGFVEYETEQAASAALEGLNGQQLADAPQPLQVVVNFPKGDARRPQGRGKGKGKGKGKGAAPVMVPGAVPAQGGYAFRP